MVEMGKYIVDYCGRVGKPTNSVALTRIQYFIFLDLMKTRDMSNYYDSPFQKWTYGPVNVRTYERFNIYGALPISYLLINPFSDDENEEGVRIRNEYEFLDPYIERYIDVFALTLSEKSMTHYTDEIREVKLKHGRSSFDYSYELLKELSNKHGKQLESH